MMKLLCVLALASTVLVQGGPGMSPSNPSPHCGQAAGSFPVPPDPVCTPPAILNQACIIEAREQYQQDMQNLAMVACATHILANQDWGLAMDSAISAYNACMQGATTAAQKAACKLALKNASATATKALHDAIQDAEDAYNEGAAALLANFGAGCCVTPDGGGGDGR